LLVVVKRKKLLRLRPLPLLLLNRPLLLPLLPLVKPIRLLLLLAKLRRLLLSSKNLNASAFRFLKETGRILWMRSVFLWAMFLLAMDLCNRGFDLFS
jgi:hypothetical protein